MLAIAETIQETKSQAMKEKLFDVIAKRKWEEEDWLDPEYEYSIPKISGKKRKTPTKKGL